MAKQHSPRLKAIVAGIAACGSMFAASQAHAYVYASSTVQITDLSIVVTGLSNSSAPTYSFTATNTATLDNSVIASSTCVGTAGGATTCGVAPVLDPAAVNAAGGTVNRANGDFSYLGPNGVDSFANSDSVITSATLVNGTLTSTRQIAETLLNTNGTARANAEITSNTSLFWVFSVGSSSGSLELDFNANPQLRAAISELNGGFFDAQGNINASFTLTRTNGGGFVSWAPNGSTDQNCFVAGLAGVTCNEDADDFSLNANRSTGVNPDDEQYRYGDASFGAYGVTLRGLQEGTYSLALNVNTSAVVTRIPEPGTLALLGLGSLASFGIAARRRREKKA